MIVRLWRGRARDEAAVAVYLAHVATVVLPKLAPIDRFVCGRVLQRHVDGEIELLAMTEWRSWEAVTAFAGPHSEVAVVEPEAQQRGQARRAFHRRSRRRRPLPAGRLEAVRRHVRAGRSRRRRPLPAGRR